MIEIILKFKKILNRRQKVRVIIIGILMVIGAILETLSVSMIVPLISVVINPQIIETNEYAKMVCEVFDIQSSRIFTILVIIALICLFILKNVFLYIEYYIQNRFVYNNCLAIRHELFASYLQRPYEYFLHVNSGEVIRVLGADVSNAFNLLTTVLSFFTELLLSLSLILLLFFTDTLMTVMIGSILLLLMITLAKIIKPILKREKLLAQKNGALASKWLLQAITGIKDLKVSHKEDFFLEEYRKAGRSVVVADGKNVTLSNVPRLLIETVSITGMLGVIGILILGGRELNTMWPQLSAFALAAIRLMPSANRLSTAYNSMSYLEPSLDKVIETLEVTKVWEKKGYCTEMQENRNKAFRVNTKIEMCDVSYKYPESEEDVLSDVSLKIKIGQSVGIVGTSGAGKTTLVDVLIGLLPPSGGRVEADGIDISQNYYGWLKQIAYIPQMIFMLDDTIKSNIAFAQKKDDILDDDIWRALEEAQLADFVRKLPQGIYTEIGERGVRLSGGQRQRIGIARALYKNPEILVFDEATSALDNETEAAIMESINRLRGRKTMIIIAHRLETIKSCDIVYRVENGNVYLEE